LVEALRHVQAIAVMDRSISFGAMGNSGPLFSELASAFFTYGPRIPMVDYVYGLGGRDISPEEVASVYRDTLRIAATGEIERLVTFLGVRETA
jgi:pyruvate ferredoxin oxidoreductase alpha subunit